MEDFVEPNGQHNPEFAITKVAFQTALAADDTGDNIMLTVNYSINQEMRIPEVEGLSNL